MQRGLAPKPAEGLLGFPGARGDGGRRGKERHAARTVVEFHFCLHFLVKPWAVFPDWYTGSVAVWLGTWESRFASLVSASSSVKSRDGSVIPGTTSVPWSVVLCVTQTQMDCLLSWRHLLRGACPHVPSILSTPGTRFFALLGGHLLMPRVRPSAGIDERQPSAFKIRLGKSLAIRGLRLWNPLDVASWFSSSEGNGAQRG